MLFRSGLCHLYSPNLLDSLDPWLGHDRQTTCSRLPRTGPQLNIVWPTCNTLYHTSDHRSSTAQGRESVPHQQTNKHGQCPIPLAHVYQYNHQHHEHNRDVHLRANWWILARLAHRCTFTGLTIPSSTSYSSGSSKYSHSARSPRPTGDGSPALRTQT